MTRRHGCALIIDGSAVTEEEATEYVFDQAWERERDRLRGLEFLFGSATIRYLADLGVTAGWRCLEVGCGAGAVALWLADQVGTAGRIVATDLTARRTAHRHRTGDRRRPVALPRRDG